MKYILPSLIFALICNFAIADGHEDCAMMKGDAIDPEEFSEILGKKVYFCCGTCVKYFDAAPAYYIKALPALGKLFDDAEKKELGVDKINYSLSATAPFIPNESSIPNQSLSNIKVRKFTFGPQVPFVAGPVIQTNISRKLWIEDIFHTTNKFTV